MALQANNGANYARFGTNARVCSGRSFTIEAWINASSFPADAGDGGGFNVIAGGQSSAPAGWEFGYQSYTGTLYLGWTNNGTNYYGYGIAALGDTVAVPVPTGRWVHVAALYDASTATYRLAVDGVIKDRSPALTALAAATAALGIRQSYDNAGFSFTGAISRVRLWEGVITGQQLQRSMRSVTVPPELRRALLADVPLRREPTLVVRDESPASLGIATQTGTVTQAADPDTALLLRRPRAIRAPAASITVAPGAAAAALSAQGPTAVIAGSLALSPGQAQAALSGQGPTAIVLGSLGLSPGAALATLSGQGPDVALGALSVVPGAAQATLSGQGPTTVLGALTLALGHAAAALTGQGLDVVLGGLSIAPGQAAATLSGEGPTVQAGGDVAIDVGAAVAALSGQGPTVVLGALSLAPGAAQASLTGQGLTVEAGGLALAPGAALASLSGQGPTTIAGSLALAVGAALAALSAEGLSVLGGGVAVDPGAAAAALSTQGLTVVAGSLTIDPGAAVAVLTAYGPTVVGGVVFFIGPLTIRAALIGPSAAAALIGPATSAALELPQ